MRLIRTIAYICILFLYSCTKDEPVNNLPIADFEYTDEIDQFSLINKSNDLDGNPLTYKWSCNSDLVRLSNTSQKNNSFKLPQLTESEEITIQLTVDDGFEQSTISKNISLPIYTLTRQMGLGQEIIKEKSNNVNYDFYLDQMITGIYSDVNCGPTTVTMAIKWINENFDKTPENARNTYQPEGGWWYTDDIINYLSTYSVSNKTIDLTNINLLQNEIDNNNIIILCLDMYYIKYQDKNNWHVDKFYKTSDTGWGHFILIKGYKQVDKQLYFEVYDPYSYGSRYSDNTLKGIDRYYRSTDLDEATNIWWDYAIVVSRNSFAKSEGLDITKIKHNYGL